MISDANVQRQSFLQEPSFVFISFQNNEKVISLVMSLCQSVCRSVCRMKKKQQLLFAKLVIRDLKHSLRGLIPFIVVSRSKLSVLTLRLHLFTDHLGNEEEGTTLCIFDNMSMNIANKLIIAAIL